MTITKWQPFGNLLTLHGRINRLFEDEFHKDWERGTGSLESWYPAADIYETKDEYVFKLEVPGLAKEDLNVEFNDNVLSIKGEKKKEKDVKEENFHRIESFSGSFSRSFTLPRNADAGKINASMKNGVLELRISKAEEKKAKAIAIDVK